MGGLKIFNRYNLVYAIREITNRKGRYAISVLGIAIAVALLISLSALSLAYSEAARIPLKEVGSDLVVQKYGKAPTIVSGPILSCSIGPMTQKEIDKMNRLDGIEEISPALVIWVFDKDYFKIVTGIDPDCKLGKMMAAQVEEGEFIKNQTRTAVVEKNFAQMYGINLHDNISINNNDYTVIGLLNAQRQDKIGSTNIIIPMQDAQEMAYNSRNIQNTVPFRKDDVNMLFLTVDQDNATEVKTQIERILGRNSRVSSLDSFLPQVSSVLSVTNSFSNVMSLMAVLVSSLLLFKTTAGTILQRKVDIGLLKAVGWTKKDVRAQILVESSILTMIGGLSGIFLGWIAILMLGMVNITIPIPQDLSSNPFLAADTQLQVTLPVSFSMNLAVLSVILVAIAGAVGGLLASRNASNLKPAEVFQNE